MLKVYLVVVVLGIVSSALANSGSGGSECSFSSGSSVTIPLGQSSEVHCVTWECKDVNGNPTLTRTSDYKCSVTSNGVEHCLKDGEALHCLVCHIDESNTAKPISTTQQCSYNNECLDEGEKRVSSCRTRICNAENWQMVLQPQDKCSFNGACYEGGAQLEYDCTGYVCNAETWNMDIETPKDSCNFNNVCVTTEYMPDVPVNGELRTCKCVTIDTNSIMCQA